MKKIFLLLAITIPFNAFSQLANFGNVIYTAPGSIVKVGNSLVNDNTGMIVHNGLLDIDKQFINTKGEVKGPGIYKVTEDWINSALFTPDTSHVYLRGAAQKVTGTSHTHFYNLTLKGTGLKEQTLSSYVLNQINLNNLEFSTGKDTLFVENKKETSVTYDKSFNAEGFISSLNTTGCVAWVTDANKTYLFPVGNKIPQYRFRPVLVSSGSSANKRMYVRFINSDATLDSKAVSNRDTFTCVVNNKFYHMVNKDGSNDSSLVSIYYVPSADGNWKAIDEWKNIWTFQQKSDSISQGNFQSLRTSLSSFNQPYLALSTKTSLTPNLITTPVCLNDEVSYPLPPSKDTYHYNITNGSIVKSSSSSITVNWNTVGNGSIKLSSNNGMCESRASYSAIQVKQIPTALFTPDTNTVFVSSEINLKNSSLLATTYTWDFGDGISSTSVNPNHYYENEGQYSVSLLAKSDNGCTNKIVQVIYVVEGFKIPDVITPNGDGKNDVFTFLGASKYDLDIFNRWGTLIYSGNESSLKWDGTALNGEPCSEGTYLYVLTFRSAKSKAFNGTIALFR